MGTERARRSPQRVPPLGRKNYQWWARTFGTRLASAKPPCDEGIHEAEEEIAFIRDRERALFDAIRVNRVAQVERWVADCPAIAVTKPKTKVASFFGRHEIVKLLLKHGADRNLACEGIRPIDVAGMGRSDAVDRMKVRALLASSDEVDVMIEAASSQEPLRLHIHFSEHVDAFTSDDVVAHGCRVARFSRLRHDMYMAVIELDPPSPSSSTSEAGREYDGRAPGRPFVQIPAGAAMATSRSRPSSEPGGHRVLNRASAPLYLSAAAVAASQPQRLRLHPAGPTG